MQKTIRLLIVALAIWACSAPLNAGAAPFVDIFGGISLTSDEDLSSSSQGPSGLNINFKLNEANFEESFIGGIRQGAWIDQLPHFGIAIEAFYFAPDLDRQNLDFTSDRAGSLGEFGTLNSTSGKEKFNGTSLRVITIDVLAMLRIPLRVSKEFPSGAIQPYAFAGPGLFILKTDDDDIDTNIGLVTGGGLRLMVNKSAGFILEYRYTSFSPEMEINSAATRVRLKGDLNTHSALVGLTINF